MELFLRRRPEISIRKSENTSIARSIGMSREAVEAHFADLRVMTEHSLFDKPGHIYNTDETGLQLNTRAGHVLAEKGSKSIPSISPGEKGETISVIACCNAEGGFIPPYCIFKGKNKKEEWLDGMPPGSQIKMSKKSAYVNGEIFLDWLQTQFLPRKPLGKVLLILDGHTSHTTNLDFLEFSEENNIILFCLPAHTTHYLQPLDRAFFKSLKGHYYDACRHMLRSNPKRVLNRLQFGKLLGEAWGKSATAQNAISAFNSTGILPYNPLAIPDYAFLNQNPVCAVQNPVNNETIPARPDCPQPGPSGIQHQYTTPNKSTAADNITPSKALDEVSPVPVISFAVKRARKKISGDLTSPEFIKNKKEKMTTTKKSVSKVAVKSLSKKTRKNKYSSESSSSEDQSGDGGVLLNDHSSGDEQFSDLENECVGCNEDYRLTKKKDEWLQCILCKRWLHESCTSFMNLCQNCGNVASKNRKSNDVQLSYLLRSVSPP